MSDTETVQPNVESTIVDEGQYFMELQKYYKGHKEKSKKLAWTSDRIEHVIRLLHEYNKAKSIGKRPTNQQYHHANKYDVRNIDNQKVLILKRKTASEPEVQIIPSEDYYHKILQAHIATGHGRRDKIVHALRDKYIIPIFAITIFLNLCKTCLSKKGYSKSGIAVKSLIPDDINKTTRVAEGRTRAVESETFPDEVYNVEATGRNMVEAPHDNVTSKSVEEQFSLCWKNFHSNMSSGFHGLLSRGDLVDVTLAAEGRLIQAHKLVLSVCSPYFQEMFKMNPTQYPIIFLQDVSHSVLSHLLEFMYQGEVNVKQEELALFLRTADQLQVKGLAGFQIEEASSPAKPKPTSRPSPTPQQRPSVTIKMEADYDPGPACSPIAIKRPNRTSLAPNDSSPSQSGLSKRKCLDHLQAGPSGSTDMEFVTTPHQHIYETVVLKTEPDYDDNMWDHTEDSENHYNTIGDYSNMDITGYNSSATSNGNNTGSGEGGTLGTQYTGKSVAPCDTHLKQ